MNEDLRPVNKMKGQGVGDIGPVALAVGVGIIIVAIVALILAEMNTQITDANATQVLDAGLAAIITFSDFFGVIVIVAVSVIILSLVMLLSRFQGTGGRA